MPPTEYRLISKISLLSKAKQLADVHRQLIQIGLVLEVAQLDLLVEYWAVSGEARRLWFSSAEAAPCQPTGVRDTDYLFGRRVSWLVGADTSARATV